MAIGDIIFELMGQGNPRREMLTAMAGQQGGAAPAPAATAAPGAPTPLTGGGDPSQAAPAPAPQQAQAVTTPPDISQLYNKLIEREERTRRFDQGLGLLGASLARDENRGHILQAFGVGNDQGRADPTSVIENAMKLQANMRAIEQKAVMRAQVPAIARKYGLDTNTALMLFESGKLDAYIADQEKVNNEIVTQGDGTQLVVNKTTAQPVGSTFGVATPPTATSDMKELDRANSERAAAGQPPLTMEEWLAIHNKQRKAETNINTSLGRGLNEQVAKIWGENRVAAEGARDTNANFGNAHAQLDKGIIGGDATAEAQLQGRKIIGSLFGMNDESIANTEAFNGTMQTAVGTALKAFGSGASITEKDREYVTKGLGADPKLNETAIRRILVMNEVLNRQKIKRFNAETARLQAIDPNSGVTPVDMPEWSPYMKRMMAQIDPKAVEMLRANPTEEEKAEFNSTFGSGAAQFFLGD